MKQIRCIIVIVADKGACNLNLQVVFTCAWNICSFIKTSTKNEWNAQNEETQSDHACLDLPSLIFCVSTIHHKKLMQRTASNYWNKSILTFNAVVLYTLLLYGYYDYYYYYDSICVWVSYTGLPIFCADTEPQNSQKHAKYREIR